MKKIVLVGLVVLLFTSCDQFIPKNITIDNKSNAKAIVNIKTFTDSNKEEWNKDYEILAGKKTALSLLYYNIAVDLKSVGRNHLKKLSSSQYQILNSSSVPFIVYNTTSKQVNLSDVNNLFDSTVVNPNQENVSIDIFNPQKAQPIAVSVPDGIVLQAQIQGNKIIIKY